MHLCLSCRFVSPAGSLLCGRCGRSFGGRLCSRHHLSPAGSQFCVQCGKQELTESTLFLSLGWVSRLIAWGGALLLISLITHHASGLAYGLWAVAWWAVVHLLNVCPCAVVRELVRALTWLLALLLLSWLLPGTAGARLRGALLGTLRWTGHAAFRMTRAFGVWLYRRVEGAPAAPEKTEKKKKKH